MTLSMYICSPVYVPTQAFTRKVRGEKKGSEGEDTETPPPPHPRGGGRPTPGEKKKKSLLVSLRHMVYLPSVPTYIVQLVNSTQPSLLDGGGKEVRGREGRSRAGNETVSS